MLHDALIERHCALTLKSNGGCIHLKEVSRTKRVGPSGDAVYSHAYIVWGGNDEERSAFARKLAAAMICEGPDEKPCGKCVNCVKAARGIHPDIILSDHNEQSRTIYVDQIRALRKDAVIMPNEAEKKVYIISHAGSMNASAQNALLKVLEEPPCSASFILAVETPAELLPTVRSRCAAVPVETLQPSAESVVNGVAADFLTALTDPMKLTELSFQLEKLEKSAFIDFIQDAKAAVVLKLKDRFNGEAGALAVDYLINTVEVLDRAKEYFYSNVGLGHIAGMICAELYIRNEEQHD